VQRTFLPLGAVGSGHLKNLFGDALDYFASAVVLVPLPLSLEAVERFLGGLPPHPTYSSYFRQITGVGRIGGENSGHHATVER